MTSLQSPPTEAPVRLPDYSDVVAAASRLASVAHRTPVLTSSTADALGDAHFFFKCENFQRMGAFKFRGAYNALAQFSPAQKAAGVITFSSGNHGQGIALSAKLLGIPALIVMPADAPASKLAAVRGYGAEVVLFDRFKEDRESLTQGLRAKRGMTLIPPFDHPDVIAGQGTAAKELIEETGPLDFLYVCLGGGGLTSGTVLAAAALAPECKVIGVEPEAGNDAQQSLKAGHIVHIKTPQTLADGAQTQHIGHANFAIMKKGVHDIVTVSDAQLVDGMRFFAERMKMVVEPTGCLGWAGASAESERARIRGARVGVIISGGNVDLARYARLLAAA
ncbi:MAG: threo-3-hydroxy-L-aspartate ammonia-lyase [Pseudomonadota bacterium]